MGCSREFEADSDDVYEGVLGGEGVREGELSFLVLCIEGTALFAWANGIWVYSVGIIHVGEGFLRLGSNDAW